MFSADAAGSPAAGPDRPRCSARGCRRDGAFELRWNNPALHPPDRRKTWLACDEHREHLSAFLSVRGFLRETVARPRPEGEADPGDGAGGRPTDETGGAGAT